MEQWEQLIEKLKWDLLQKIIFVKPFHRDVKYEKIRIYPVQGKQMYFQAEKFFGKQVHHENLKDMKALVNTLNDLYKTGYRECHIFHAGKEFIILTGKKGNMRIKEIDVTQADKVMSKNHNKEKKYIIPEGVPIPWLTRLGIMNTEGMVYDKKQKKFRQINRFLEFIQTINHYLPHNVYVVDIGCGKSYLTFALYYYLKECCGHEVEILGIDTKEEVVQNCNRLAGDFQFAGLHFEAQDIRDFTLENEKVNMVVSLHACDTATDYALFLGMKWQAEVIMSVPCCQHELFSQIQNDMLESVLKHGILKERFSSILTDGVRALLMEALGYKTDVMEFIDMEHTAKNILIRGVRKNKQVLDYDKIRIYKALAAEYQINPNLYRLLQEEYGLE